MKKLTIEEFISRATAIHGNVFDYSLVEYKSLYTKVKIICPKHGEFIITPYNHIKGHGCPFCSKAAKLNTENFAKKVKYLYGDKFDCSLAIIKDDNNFATIKCNTCGNIFEVDKYKFVSSRQGGKCPFCQKEQFRLKRQDLFLKNSHNKFGNKFEYPNLFYVNNSTKIKVFCPIHGFFAITPQHHLNSSTGCPQCSIDELKDKLSLSQEQFIERAKEVHGEKYIYEKTIYRGMFTQITITCKKHGDFTQLPVNHLKGQGCTSCKNSIGEERIFLFLRKHKIEFKKEFCIHNEYLFSNRKKLLIDFYLPKYNIFIEFNGEQHYHPYTLFGGEKQLKEQQERDNAVRQYCHNHKIKLIEIPYTSLNDIENILKRELKIKR